MSLPLDDAAAADPQAAGGKASTLARLRRAGFPVPDGFVVTAGEDLAVTLGPSLAALRDRVGAGVRFAVRSSGLAEDSAAASFAGQYETVLGVADPAGVADAIARCFASFSGSRARAYQAGVGVADAGGAVLVQHLVPADAAGVAFTVDPVTGARDRVVIDAARGLGDAVVGGRVTPDGFAVAKGTGAILARRTASGAGALDDEGARAVAALAERVERHEGRPVDIEWALHAGALYLLQARPITTDVREGPPPGWVPELNTPIDPRFPLYSSGNVSEILPGCVTPLTYSLFARGVERAFRHVAESLGSMPDVGARPVVVGFFFHRVYLNASYFMAAADNSPGATRDTVHEELIGPATERHPAWKAADLLPWRFVRGVRIIGRYLAQQGRLAKDIDAVRQRYHESLPRFGGPGPAAWASGELAAWVEANDADLEPAVVHVRASQFANSSFASLKGMTRRWLADESGAVAASLVTGIGTLASASPAYALYELGRAAAASPEVERLFRSEPDDERLLAQLDTAGDPALVDFRGRLRQFVEQFGHRGFREAEFRSPSWRERPALVVAHARKHLQPAGSAPETIAERQRLVAAAARERALARLAAWQRGIFTSTLANARAHIAAREEMKDLLLRYLDLTRRVLAEAQRRLAGVLARPDDIYFLLDREVARALRGELARGEAARIVERRRREHEWSSRLAVPKVQDGVPRVIDAAAGAGADAALAGIPVSPGVVEGRACVVLDPNDARLEEGDILVAPVTDVAWTPLFLRAAALVVEIGGPLSHGSIVAREYGIPAVTGVAGATRDIRSGDVVRVDGSRGAVTIVRRG